jgi:hypothetical protein
MQQLPAFQRWIPLSGIVFVVLLIVGMGLMDLPTGDDSDQTVSAFYADHGNRVEVICAFYLLTIGGIAFLFFANRLRLLLAAAPGAPPPAATFAFGAGVVFLSMYFVSAAAMATIAGAVSIGGEELPDVSFERFFPQLGYAVLLVPGMFAASVMIAVTSYVSMQSRIFPGWFAWLGFVVAILLLFGAAFLPALALPVWVLIASVLMLQEQPQALVSRAVAGV